MQIFRALLKSFRKTCFYEVSLQFSIFILKVSCGYSLSLKYSKNKNEKSRKILKIVFCQFQKQRTQDAKHDVVSVSFSPKKRKQKPTCKMYTKQDLGIWNFVTNT